MLNSNGVKKIIVVDDDYEQRDLYESLFKENGFDVVGVKDGKDAWERISKEKFDLVFTGIIIPGMDGFTIIENMRKNPLTAHVPVIMFSHRGREEDQARAKGMGVEFMIKGYNKPKDIVETVKNLLNQSSAVPKPIPHKNEEDDRLGTGTL
jgi:DNA-binding response OmpR family regulator